MRFSIRVFIITTMMASERHVGKSGLLSKLQELGIHVTTIEHEEVFTIEQMIPHVGHLPGALAKNLFMRDKKKKGLWVLSARHNVDVNLNDLAKKLGATKGLRLADESVLIDKLGVKQGCVTPFALINDVNNEVRFVIDEGLLNGAHEVILFHPMVNTATSSISPKDLLKFLDAIGHPPTPIRFEDPQTENVSPKVDNVAKKNADLKVTDPRDQPSCILYTYAGNFRAYKALVAAQYSKKKVKVSCQAPEFIFGDTNKSEAFLQKFLTEKIPALEDTETGITLFESNAIAHYLASESLRGENLKSRAEVRQWMHFADTEIVPPSCTWVFPCMGIMSYNKQQTESAKMEVKQVLSVLNTVLLRSTFLVGQRVSLADVCVACCLLHLYHWVLEPEFRAPYKNVNRWFLTIVNQPEFRAIVGDFKMCEKMAQFDIKQFRDICGAKTGHGKMK